ncbi:MAG: D-aminoacyl-tRNA deacylase [Natronomonas sp.]|jgi:D-aminoacyl-tRNA deacylase|uniref:D-aminoacyl-tRNA deacylase n=1 Tax=Natronomonas sp. TaxID=2184060 RepID=UPI0028703A37|nr:D-aminoacyl-tRNA deacylase [Natronomonas sp.]MDR9380931.1 D-aminoacyl-tRNA deacylase [Natronomonas sp.]MDR9429722.1 D-aminoacyl-tRNA deacylase [Natronomonas sp.]
MLAVVVSRADEASEHIGEQLLDFAEWDELEDERRSDANGGGRYYRAEGVELRTFDDLHIHLDGVAATFDDPDLLVFASRHAGDTGPLLTAHATGNFGSAEYGGRAGSLARAAPNALSVVRGALETHAPSGYDIGVECTHHGPSTVGCPSLFVEVGSDEPQWRDPDATRAVARAILDLRGVAPHRERTVVGFGGSHYAPRFDRALTETDWSVGHVAADWALDELGDPRDARAVVAKAFQMSGTEFALLDGSSPELEVAIDELGFERLSETFLRETTGVSLDLVGRIERALGSIDDGTRLGAPATAHDGEFLTRDLPAELLEEANGIDRGAVLEAVDSTAIAYETADSGSLVAGSIALFDADGYRTAIRKLAAVLENKYDVVDVRDSEVFVRREAFDPELARAAGVEDGPAFGRLSAGEAVEVDGAQVAPADVRTTRERCFET